MLLNHTCCGTTIGLWWSSMTFLLTESEAVHEALEQVSLTSSVKCFLLLKQFQAFHRHIP